MEATVVASIIAATVSVGSVIANLYIARGTRRSAIEALRVKASLDAASEANKTIREVEVEGERLRIRGWDLLTHLRTAEIDPTTRFDSAWQTTVHKFALQSEQFFDKWAEAKAEISPESQNMLRRMRHECRSVSEGIIAMSVHLEHRVKRGERDIARKVADLTSNVEMLLREVDSFTCAVRLTRRDLTESPLLCDQSKLTFRRKKGVSTKPTL